MRIPASAFLKLAVRSVISRIAARRPPRPAATPAELRLRGLGGDAWICRDGHGIPRITAGDEAEIGRASCRERV